MRCFKIYETVK